MKDAIARIVEPSVDIKPHHPRHTAQSLPLAIPRGAMALKQHKSRY